MNGARYAGATALRHSQIVAGLLVLLVACPFTAPCRTCKPPRSTTRAVHAPTFAREARVQLGADPVAPPSSIAEDPNREDILLLDDRSVAATTSDVVDTPPAVPHRDIQRLVVAALRL